MFLPHEPQQGQQEERPEPSKILECARRASRLNCLRQSLMLMYQSLVEMAEEEVLHQEEVEAEAIRANLADIRQKLDKAAMIAAQQADKDRKVAEKYVVVSQAW